MSLQSFEAFRAVLAEDPTLQATTRQALGQGGMERVLALAQQRGFDFTEAEALEGIRVAELSDDELDLVSGGGCRGGNMTEKPNSSSSLP